MSWPIKYTYNHETLIIEDDACLSPMLISGGRGQCSSDASIGVGYSHSASARHASDEAEELNEEVNLFLILLNHTSCSYASAKLWTWAGCPTLMFGSQSRVPLCPATQSPLPTCQYSCQNPQHLCRHLAFWSVRQGRTPPDRKSRVQKGSLTAELCGCCRRAVEASAVRKRWTGCCGKTGAPATTPNGPSAWTRACSATKRSWNAGVLSPLYPSHPYSQTCVLNKPVIAPC